MPLTNIEYEQVAAAIQLLSGEGQQRVLKTDVLFLLGKFTADYYEEVEQRNVPKGGHIG